jgi:hypothetical protein
MNVNYSKTEGKTSERLTDKMLDNVDTRLTNR